MNMFCYLTDHDWSWWCCRGGNENQRAMCKGKFMELTTYANAERRFNEIER
jgi:hypothetical protein